MAQRIFAFQPPAWRTPGRLLLNTGSLFAGTILWLLVYGWLGYRLWAQGLGVGLWLTGMLSMLVIVLGVLLVLGWRRTGGHWLWRLHGLARGEQWPALTLEQTLRLTPSEFEAYVAYRIFERQGYNVVNTPDVKDGGIDVLVSDGRGARAVVQCKRYKGTVGESTVRDLYGTMIHDGATHAYLITTGAISDEARRWASGKTIDLVDGPRLVELARAEPQLRQS